MSSIQKQEQTAATFKKVFKDELNDIRKKEGDPLIGLALSGGGIRSATFNLGVIQGLAENKVFDKFDYLSTVSGGGYIGSWLSAWIYHKSQPDAQGFIKSGTTIQDDLIESIDVNNDQSKPVKFLRDYSNYLTPHTGLFSMDTLSAVATYTRNLILNLSILILALALVLMMPMFLQKVGALLQNHNYFWRIFGVDALLLIVAVIMITYNLIYTDLQQAKAKVSEEATSALSASVVIIVIAVLIDSWLTALILTDLVKIRAEVPFLVILGTGGIYLGLWAIAYLASLYIVPQCPAETVCTASEWTSTQKPLKKTDWRELLQWALFTFVAGCIGGCLFLAIIYLLATLDEVLVSWLVVVFGPPIIVSIFSLIVIFHIGLMGRYFSVAQHEWWSRLGANLIAAMAVWMGIAGIAILGPPAFDRLTVYLSATTLTSGWLASTISGILAAKSSATGKKDGDPKLEIMAQIAPYVFVIGLLIAVSYGLQQVYFHQNNIVMSAITEYCPSAEKDAVTPCFTKLVNSELAKMNGVSSSSFLVDFACILIVVAVLAWRVNINLFSLHNFYRYRLTRAYLGASRPERNPHPYTGFDENDDIALSELAKHPYHIINAAINFTDGGKLSVQDRKAGSFVFTPNYCGYQLEAGLNSGFYRKSNAYGKYDKNDKGFRLGSAVAVSGAAANPNMGFHSSPAVAFLLTTFNVRLGRWCGNPGNESGAWKKADPPFGFWYLLGELFGYSNLESRFVNLSDGGHFENLGLYELVRRQCKYIVVCDAGADEDFNFEDLAGAIRKCRTDFGVEIEMNDLDELRLDPGSRFSNRHYATGRIIYDSNDPDPEHRGTLLLLKPSLTKKSDFPADVRNYADMNETFPQQSTADQWFNEAQFESYRKLGYYIVHSLFADDTFDKKAHGLM